jgi:hypothetical protein
MRLVEGPLGGFLDCMYFDQLPRHGVVQTRPRTDTRDDPGSGQFLGADNLTSFRGAVTQRCGPSPLTRSRLCCTGGRGRAVALSGCQCSVRILAAEEGYAGGLRFSVLLRCFNFGDLASWGGVLLYFYYPPRRSERSQASGGNCSAGSLICTLGKAAGVGKKQTHVHRIGRGQDTAPSMYSRRLRNRTTTKRQIQVGCW